jgi:hypothetical protein
MSQVRRSCICYILRITSVVSKRREGNQINTGNIGDESNVDAAYSPFQLQFFHQGTPHLRNEDIFT